MNSRTPPAKSAFSIILFLCAADGAPAQAPFVRGDINQDGQVSLADISYYFDARYLGAPPPECLDAVDTDDDGQIDFQLLADAQYLMSWLFRSGTQPPAPFPKPGADPTQDGLACADGTIMPPGEPAAGFALEWESPLYVKQGQTGVESFLLVTTTRPIECFSIAYRVDRKFHVKVRADLEGTIFPAALKKSFESSPVFQVKVTQSADPRYDLLLAGAVFVMEDGKQPNGAGDGGGGAVVRVPFAATQAPIHRARLLRVVADVREDAPLHERTPVLLPATAEDLVPGVNGLLHGIQNELGSSIGDRLGVALRPRVIEHADEIALDAGEFLRADANSDHCLDISDARSLLDFLFLGGRDPECPDAADSNDDGRIDISDGVFTLSYLFSGGSAPPPERFAGFCFFDSTEDVLGECIYECRECPR